MTALLGPVATAALLPLSALYGKALEARARWYADGRLRRGRVPCPVVSVGNLTFGGTGKTPMVEFLARRLRFEGSRPAVVSRGYGRRSRGVVVVSSGAGPRVGPDEGGDEPVAIARRLPAVPVVVGERRFDAAKTAVALGADVLVLDDGYQHLALERDVDLLLLDAGDPFGGGELPPAGRLREPLSALARADAFVFTRVDRFPPSNAARSELSDRNPQAPVFTARLRPEGLWDENGSPVPAAGLIERRFIGVCGIANPAAFAASLAELELTPAELVAFPDHRRYGRRDLERIERAAERNGSAWIVTTEKDAVKLFGTTRLPIVTLRVEVEMGEPGLFPFLLDRISRGAPKPKPAGGRLASAPRP